MVLNSLNHLRHLENQNSVLLGYLIGFGIILAWFTIWLTKKYIIEPLWHKYKSSSYYENKMVYKNLERENILQLYKIGYPIEEIAKLHCVNELTVRKYLKSVLEE